MIKSNVERKIKLFVIAHNEKEIRATKGTLDKASVYGTDEFKALQLIRKDLPDYEVKEDSSAKNTSNRKTYKGCSFSTMEKYIRTQPNAEENLKTFEAVKFMASIKGAKYPLTKKWFLATFPNFKENSTDDITEEFEQSEDLAIADKAVA